MKKSYPRIGLARICRLFGVTRQAYYQDIWNGMDTSLEHEIILQMVEEIRRNHARMGVRKIYERLAPKLLEYQIKIGRDGLFDLFASHGLLVRRRRRKIVTTQSNHWLRKYPNLVDSWELDGPDQVWVSDITYLRGSLFLSLVTDAYSKKIVGYHVGNTLEAKHTLEALKMATSRLSGPRPTLIHHSDRGVQYCSQEYVKHLQDYQIKISMGQKGDPLENPVAERVNGIIKHEYLYSRELKNSQEALKAVQKVVWLYNNERPHLSCGMLTPNEAHKQQGALERKWKNYYRKKTTVAN